MQIAAALPHFFTPFHPRRQNLPPLNSLPIPPSQPPHKLQPPKPSPSPTPLPDTGIPTEHITTLAKFKSLHNNIQVLQISRFSSSHPLSGTRILLLDTPGNIHSISNIFKTLTHSYFDIFSTLPPLLPPSPAPLVILGFGAGTAATLILNFYPTTLIHGYELDHSVLSVARQFFNLDKLEKKHRNNLFVYTGNALEASVNGGFSGIIVDLFSEGCVIPELQNVETWRKLRSRLRKGGRIMVNVGGSCVEPEDRRKDGRVVMEETLKAMSVVFPGEVYVLKVEDRDDDSAVAMTGGLPDLEVWKKALKCRPLKAYVDMWKPYEAGE